MISNKLIEKERDVLKNSIKKKQRFIDETPDGSLRCRKNGNRYNWFVVYGDKSDTRAEKYIQKSERKLAEKMALKGLYVQDLLDEKQELSALETFLKKRSKFERREKFLSRSDGIMELVESRLKKKWPADVETWLSEHIEFDAPNPEGKKFRCKNGMMVRSKSEQIIVSALVEHNVPFKYEEPVYLGNYLYCPDFIAMNARTGEKFVWEHFGMMDNPEYYERNLKKINKYFEFGYVPFVNFIMTFEIENSGVDDMWIEKIIETFLE